MCVHACVRARAVRACVRARAVRACVRACVYNTVYVCVLMENRFIISRNARSQLFGLYILVYFRITPIENEWLFINLIVN